eukprot:gb/GECH01010097.1/.p1 GENE.gb/GECH01010097.1/~~gb/GECH01010097.1/.p1  ORF type:complete len:135 (+),score=3.84 gb/GECH01010097.1/:1-405(+)
MDVRDAESGNTLTSVDWSSKDMFTGQHALTIPKAILECRAVTRELTFSIGPQPIQDLAVTQKVLLHRTLIEEWHFNFGFAIPSSTNTWSTTLEAADEMLPAQTLRFAYGNFMRLSLFTNFHCYYCIFNFLKHLI